MSRNPAPYGTKPDKPAHGDGTDKCTCPAYVTSSGMAGAVLPGSDCPVHGKLRLEGNKLFHLVVIAKNESGQEVCITGDGESLIDLSRNIHEKMVRGNLWIESCVGWKMSLGSRKTTAPYIPSNVREVK